MVESQPRPCSGSSGAITTETLERLPNVLWIGGSTFSGKSTVAGILADRYPVEVRSCDEELPRHMQTAAPDLQPTLHLFASLIERPMLMLPPDLLAASVRAMAREQLGMIVDELAGATQAGATQAGATLPGPMIVEGAAVLPECLGPTQAGRQRAVWLLSTEEFLNANYRAAREQLVAGSLQPYSDPERAFRNWMDRDVLFAETVRRNVERLGLRSVLVDGTRPPEAIADEVARMLSLERNAA